MIGRRGHRVVNQVSSLKKGETNLPLSFISSLTENIINSQNDFVFCRYFTQRNSQNTDEKNIRMRFKLFALYFMRLSLQQIKVASQRTCLKMFKNVFQVFGILYYHIILFRSIIDLRNVPPISAIHCSLHVRARECFQQFRKLSSVFF